MAFFEGRTRRASPSPASHGVWSEELKDLLGRASISEDHRALMGAVIERISSAESGLHEAVRSLLTGFEVRENDIPSDSSAYRMRPVYIVAPETRYVVKGDSVLRIIISVLRCRLSYIGGGVFGGKPD